MTDDEKITILSFNFDIIWFKFTSGCSKIGTYNLYKAKFLLHDKKMLRDAINNSYSGELLWEIPKGRAVRSESSRETAMRELYEELNIPQADYQIIDEIPVVYHNIAEYGVSYQSKYHVAICNTHRELTFRDRQNSEVSGSKWWSMEELRTLRDSIMTQTAIDILIAYDSYIAQ